MYWTAMFLCHLYIIRCYITLLLVIAYKDTLGTAHPLTVKAKRKLLKFSPLQESHQQYIIYVQVHYNTMYSCIIHYNSTFTGTLQVSLHDID